MNLAFKHIRPGDVEPAGTYAISLPSKEDVVGCDTVGESVLFMKIGVARLSNKDNFCRRIGREAAKGRMEGVFLIYEGHYNHCPRKIKRFKTHLLNPRTGKSEETRIDLSVTDLSKYVKLETITSVFGWSSLLNEEEDFGV